jgi:hypothetical protein
VPIFAWPGRPYDPLRSDTRKRAFLPNLLTIPRKRAGVNEIDLNPGEIFTRLLPDAVPFGVFARSEFLFGVPAGFVPSPAGARAAVFCRSA